MIDIKDYEFHVGDEVITADGITGKIAGVCSCDRCIDRGYKEPYWVDEDGEYFYITNYTFANNFLDYYKIGEYIFNNIDKTSVLNGIAKCTKELSHYKKQLKVIEELQKGEQR